MKKIIITLLALTVSACSFGQYQYYDTIQAKIYKIDLEEKYSLYDCYLYDSTITNNTHTFYYVFSK